MESYQHAITAPVWICRIHSLRYLGVVLAFHAGDQFGWVHGPDHHRVVRWHTVSGNDYWWSAVFHGKYRLV